MPQLFGLILWPGDHWLIALLVGAWLAFVVLRNLAEDLDYRIRLHDLQMEAHELRQRQLRRLRELGVEDKNGASPTTALNDA